MSPLGPRESPRIVDKSPDAFRTISEVAEDLDLPQHVLRFWETRFPQIKPLKRGGGRRYYRPEDVDLLKGIRQLLYGEGYTIKGVQRILKEDGIRFVQSIGRGEQAVEAPPPGQRQEPETVHHERETDARADEDAAHYRSPEPSGSQAAPAPELQTAPPAAGTAALSIADIARLRSALKDLLECERVLKALKAQRSGEDDQLADG
jgi:DNA-binding transcriptional MerR regulator